MEFIARELLNELSEITRSNIAAAERFKTKSDEELNLRRSNESWSILECLEHLNRYGNFYIPELRKCMKSKAHIQPQIRFRSGIMGNYFANSMKLKEGSGKMKTFKSMDPIHSVLSRGVLDHFIKQQTEMLELLDDARHYNLSRIKTGISITQLLRIKLGDTFRFVIYHNQRHVVQACKVLIPGTGS